MTEQAKAWEDEDSWVIGDLVTLKSGEVGRYFGVTPEGSKKIGIGNLR